MSFGAMIPFVGAAATGAKLLYKGAKAASKGGKAADTAKAYNAINKTIKSTPNDVCFLSFSEDTLVATPEGDTPISELRPGDTVYAFNEETQTTGVYTVTASWMHFDQVAELTINDETLETTADHPFYVDKYGWMDAGELPTGAPIKSLNKSANGVVQDVRTLAASQPMYNITVDEAHTYYVGDGKWLVHNKSLCVYKSTTDEYIGKTNDFQRRSYEHSKKRKIEVIKGLENIPSEEIQKGVEQIMIEKYGRDKLVNKRNGVSPKNPQYPEIMGKAKEWLNKTKFSWPY
ncbi:MAG: hypothetical protein HC911_12630 [Chloroflexaceae bacterium]|nr:hypothetical protein [Chloroflexaceae bacterium]